MKLVCNHCNGLIPASRVNVKEQTACCPTCRTISPVKELLNLSMVNSASALPSSSRIRVDILSSGDYVIHGYNAGMKYATNESRTLILTYSLLTVLFVFMAGILSFWPLLILSFISASLAVYEIILLRRFLGEETDIILHHDSIELISKKTGKKIIPIHRIREIFMERESSDTPTPIKSNIKEMAGKFHEVPVINDGMEKIPVGITWHPLEKRWLVNFMDMVVKMRRFRMERLSA